MALRANRGRNQNAIIGSILVYVYGPVRVLFHTGFFTSVPDTCHIWQVGQSLSGSPRRISCPHDRQRDPHTAVKIKVVEDLLANQDAVNEQKNEVFTSQLE